jgi:ATP-dependent DNA helicase RecG
MRQGTPMTRDELLERLNVLRGGRKLNRVIAVEAQHFDIDGKHVFAFYVPELSRSEKPVYLKGEGAA